MSQRPRVIFSTGSLYTLDTSACFELAAEMDFDGLEVLCDERWSTRDPATLARLSERSGLPILAIHAPFSERLPGWPDASDKLDVIRRSLALAEALGAEVLVVHLPLRVGRLAVRAPGLSLDLPWVVNPFRGVRAWMANGGLAQAQAATPVQIAVENMPVVRWAWRFNPVWWNTVAEWGRVHTHLTLDTAHWATLGIDPLDAYRAADGRVRHVHLSNFDGREHRLPHKGDLDLGAFLRALAADRFSGTVCLELHPDSLRFMDERAVRRNLAKSLAFCRTHLGQAG